MVKDELPYQFQIRDFERHLVVQTGETKEIMYHLHPVKRGEYTFGSLNVFIGTFLRMAQRRVRILKIFQLKYTLLCD